MAGRGRGGPSQNEINAALLNALAGLTNHIQGLGRGNGGFGAHPVFDFARAATNISKSRLKYYAGAVDPEALDLWFRQVEKQLEINEVPHDRKVAMAAHYLEGEADRWWMMAGPTAMLAPGFGWERFKDLLEARFIPTELKHRKMEEFMSLRQETMSVQEYTDKFNKLAHYATPLLPNEAQKAFFFRNGLTAEIAYSVPRSADTVSEIYNAALWGEKGLEKVKKEKAWSASKRPLQSYSANTPNKRFQPSGGVVARRPFAPAGSGAAKEVLCYQCRKPKHPGKIFDGAPVTCYHCRAPGHKSFECPLKTSSPAAAPAVAPGSTPRPKGRVFLLSRAEAEADPDVITGTFLVSSVLASVLFDTGASVSVVSSRFASKASLIPSQAESIPISLPSGEIVSCAKAYEGVPIIISETLFPSTLIDFPLSEFDVILGMDWLALYDARFQCKEQKVMLQCPLGTQVIYKGRSSQEGIKIVSAMKLLSLQTRVACFYGEGT